MKDFSLIHRVSFPSLLCSFYLTLLYILIIPFYLFLLLVEVELYLCKRLLRTLLHGINPCLLRFQF